MNYLLPGHEPKARVEILIKLTKISSESVKAALYDHLTKGMDESCAAMVNGVAKSNFSRAMVRVNEVAGLIEDVKNIDYKK